MQQQVTLGRREHSPARAPERSLTQRAFLNVGASVLDLAAKLGVNLLIKRLLVQALGGSLFGAWELLGSLAGYMQAADGRPTNALKWVVAQRHSTQDAAENRRNVGGALAVWLLFLPVLAVLGAGLVWIAPGVAKVPPSLHGAVRIACGLLVFNVMLLGLTTVPGAVLHGMNLAHRRMGLVAGLNLLGGLLVLAAVRLNLGLPGLAAAELVLSLVSGATLWHIARQSISWFGVAKPSWSLVRSFTGLSIWYSAWTLVGRLLTESEIVLLGTIASTASVATYVIAAYAARSVLSVLTIALGAVTPGMGKLVGQAELERARAVRGELLALTWLLTTVAGTTILFANRTFIGLWIGPEHYPGPWVDLLITAAMVQLAFVRTDSYIIDVTLRLQQKVRLGVVAVLISVAWALVLIPKLGIAGVCASILCGRLVLSVGYPRLARRFLEAGPARPAALLRPAAVSVLLFGTALFAGQQVLRVGWPGWFAASCGVFCLAAIAAFRLGLTPHQRSEILGRLRKLKGGRHG